MASDYEKQQEVNIEVHRDGIPRLFMKLSCQNIMSVTHDIHIIACKFLGQIKLLWEQDSQIRSDCDHIGVSLIVKQLHLYRHIVSVNYLINSLGAICHRGYN